MRVLLLFLFAPLLSFSQMCSIKSTEHLERTRKETYVWLINGQEVTPSTQFQNIRINYPNVDTIVFLNNHYREAPPDTLYTRFKKGENYMFSISCCDNNYKIHTQKTLLFIQDTYEDLYNDSLPEDYQDSIFNAYLNVFGTVSIEVNNIPKTDSLIVFGDLSMFGNGQILTTKYNDTQKTIPAIGDYLNRHHDILFATYDTNVNWRVLEKRRIETDDVEFYSKLSKIKEVNIRVFENETALLRMNYRTGEIDIIFETDN